jgi:hypothetical protein
MAKVLGSVYEAMIKTLTRDNARVRRERDEARRRADALLETLNRYRREDLAQRKRLRNARHFFGLPLRKVK